MKLLVTGGGGFLGQALCRGLRERGHEVASFSRSRHAALDALGVRQLQGDLADRDAVLAAFGEGFDAVLHNAAKAGAWGSHASYFDANVTGTRNVIAAVRGVEVPRLMHVSSTVAVGLSTGGEPATEETPWNMAEDGLDDGYAITKRRAEELVRESGFDVVIVNPGGTGSPMRHISARFAPLPPRSGFIVPLPSVFRPNR